MVRKSAILGREENTEFAREPFLQVEDLKVLAEREPKGLRKNSTYIGEMEIRILLIFSVV